MRKKKCEFIGLETQRQWSDLAIADTLPAGAVFAGRFAHPAAATRRALTAAWYEKPEATFSDCLILVRRHLWRSLNYVDSAPPAESVSFPAPAWEHLSFPV